MKSKGYIKIERTDEDPEERFKVSITVKEISSRQQAEDLLERLMEVTGQKILAPSQSSLKP